MKRDVCHVALAVKPDPGTFITVASMARCV